MLSLDESKRLLMLSKSDVGDTIRDYFIAIERMFRDCLRDPTHNAQLIHLIRGGHPPQVNDGDGLILFFKNHLDPPPSEWCGEKTSFMFKMLSMSLRADGHEFNVSLSELATFTGQRKNNLKRSLKKLKKGKDYQLLTDELNNSGRPIEIITLTIDAVKLILMAAPSAIGDVMRTYMLEAESLFKRCLADPSNNFIDISRGQLVKYDSKALNLEQSYAKEAELCIKLRGKDVFYIYELHPTNTDKRVFDYGMTYRFESRGDEHRTRFKCEATIINAWPIVNMSRRETHNLETSVGVFISRLRLKHRYMSAKETFTINRDEDLDTIVSFVERQVNKQQPPPTTIPDSRSSERGHELEMKKLELEIMKVQLEMRRLEVAQ